MHLPLILLAVAAPPADLSFHTGRLDAWQGHGFQITTAAACGPSRSFGVTSADRGRQGGKALLIPDLHCPGRRRRRALHRGGGAAGRLRNRAGP